MSDERSILIGAGFTEKQSDALVNLLCHITDNCEPRKKKKVDKPQGSVVWDAYSEAYRKRYKTEPVRNATTNNQVKQLVARLGLEDAKGVVTFYLDHRDGMYVKNCHPIGLCLQNAEGLRTQWVRGKAITGNDVRQFEQQDHIRSQLDRISKEDL